MTDRVERQIAERIAHRFGVTDLPGDVEHEASVSDRVSNDRLTDICHQNGNIETFEIELMMADIQSLQGSISKSEKLARGGDKEAKLRVDVSRRCLAQLEAVQPLRKLEFDESEAKGHSDLLKDNRVV